MLYFDKYSKKMLGCDFEVSGKKIAKQCRDCTEDCRIKGALVMEVIWNLPQAKSGLAHSKSQEAGAAAE